jgi:hypothetical protein
VIFLVGILILITLKTMIYALVGSCGIIGTLFAIFEGGKSYKIIILQSFLNLGGF